MRSTTQIMHPAIIILMLFTFHIHTMDSASLALSIPINGVTRKIRDRDIAYRALFEDSTTIKLSIKEQDNDKYTAKLRCKNNDSVQDLLTHLYCKSPQNDADKSIMCIHLARQLEAAYISFCTGQPRAFFTNPNFSERKR